MTTLRRSAIRRRPRRNRPEVDWPALRDEVFDRDKVCFVYRLDPSHLCHTRFGGEHGPGDRRALTLEHVKEHLRTGRKGDDVARWMVAICGMENNRPPSKEVRAAMRAYLAEAAS